MIVIEYQVNDGEVQAYFDYAGYRARNMREPFTQVLSLIHSIAAAAFAEEGPDWAELTPKYAAWKERYAPGRPLLVLSEGAPLRRAATRSGRAYTDGLSYHPSARNKQGFDYAEPIFFGRPGGPGKYNSFMAARPWFEDDYEFRNEVEEIFYYWLDDLRTRNARRSGYAERPPSPLPTVTI